jgi:ComEC/Rec2-related protein
MMVTRAVGLALGYITGIVCATVLNVPVRAVVLILPATAGGLLSAWIMREEKHWRPHPHYAVALAAVLLSLPLGYYRAISVVGPPRPGSLRQALAETPHGTPMHLRGTIAAEPDARDERRLDLQVRVSHIRAGEDGWTAVKPARILLRVTRSSRGGEAAVQALNRLMDQDAYGYGIEVETRREASQRPRNPAEFDQGSFLAQQGWAARFRADVGRVAVIEETRGNVLMELALAAKRRFLVTYRHTIRSPSSRLTAAATLGTRRAVEKHQYRGKDIAQTFRHAGVGHVLAVSGLHVTVICVLLYFLFQLTGLRPRVFVPPLIFFLLLFALLTGARPSSVRAVIMNSVILVAMAYFRYDIRHATYIGLSLASLIILLFSPIILYSPSFLLSFGAVLSLVLITPTFDRWVRRLRGFALLFAGLWFAGIMTVCTVNLSVLIDPWNVTGALGLLWVLILAGGRLNMRLPWFYRIGTEALPDAIRLLICAQLSIQVGMMVPLSAWFFGQFPVAGVLVNIVAIPAIGILVQLGMLTGLAGLLPLVGKYLAMPFGATATLVAGFFFWLAHLGTEVFPFPATPKPSVAWMAGYYALLAALLSLARWLPRAQAGFYRAWPKLRTRTGLLRTAAALPLILCLAPLVGFLPRSDRCRRVTCLAARNYPILTLLSEDGKAALVNAGDSFSGERVLFNVLRDQGATSIDTAVLSGPQPRAGNEGLAALTRKMRVRRCFMPYMAQDPADYLDAVGDKYLASMAKRGMSWVLDYNQAYAKLSYALERDGTETALIPERTVFAWDDMELRRLPPLDKLPDRFASSAGTALLSIDVNGFQWIVVTETTEGALRRAVSPRFRAADVLVLPDLPSRDSYPALITTAVERARPRVVIIAGDRSTPRFDADTWAKELGSFKLFLTGRDGAVTAEFPEEGRMRLTSYASGKQVELTQRQTEN